MGRKIPGKKHRRNTDAEKQIEKREAELRLKVRITHVWIKIQLISSKYKNNVLAFRLTLLLNVLMNKKFLKDWSWFQNWEKMPKIKAIRKKSLKDHQKVTFWIQPNIWGNYNNFLIFFIVTFFENHNLVVNTLQVWNEIAWYEKRFETNSSIQTESWRKREALF